MNIYTFINDPVYNQDAKVKRVADFSLAAAERQIDDRIVKRWSLHSIDKADDMTIDEVNKLVDLSVPSTGKSF